MKRKLFCFLFFALLPWCFSPAAERSQAWYRTTDKELDRLETLLQTSEDSRERTGRLLKISLETARKLRANSTLLTENLREERAALLNVSKSLNAYELEARYRLIAQTTRAETAERKILKTAEKYRKARSIAIIEGAAIAFFIMYKLRKRLRVLSPV